MGKMDSTPEPRERSLPRHLKLESQIEPSPRKPSMGIFRVLHFFGSMVSSSGTCEIHLGSMRIRIIRIMFIDDVRTRTMHPILMQIAMIRRRETSNRVSGQGHCSG